MLQARLVCDTHAASLLQDIKAHVYAETAHLFQPEDNDWGLHNMIRLQDLLDPEQHWLIGGKLSISTRISFTLQAEAQQLLQNEGTSHCLRALLVRLCFANCLDSLMRAAQLRRHAWDKLSST